MPTKLVFVTEPYHSNFSQATNDGRRVYLALMLRTLGAFFSKPVTWVYLYALTAVAVTVQTFLLHKPDAAITNYNNYIIFIRSFDHLLHAQNLYAAYPNEYWDLYKYSPTFALMMAPFAVLPLGIGLLLWNFLNAALLAVGLQKLKGIDDRMKAVVLAFTFIELITSLQNEQSNGLVAALLVWTLVWLQREKWHWAALMVAMCAFVKILGFAAVVLFVFYPKKIRLALYTAAWSVLLLVLPAIVTGPGSLMEQYRAWGALLAMDHLDPNGFSVMNVLRDWFLLEVNKSFVQAAGVLVLSGTALLQWRNAALPDRLRLLANVLIWVVIFNHKAESPTFVIAAVGVGLWYALSKRGAWETALFVFAALFTVLNATDLFPAFIRKGFFADYAVKAVPCVAIWCASTVQLLRQAPPLRMR